MYDKNEQLISKDDLQRYDRLTQIVLSNPPFDPNKLSPRRSDGTTYNFDELKQICHTLGISGRGDKITVYERIFHELI